MKILFIHGNFPAQFKNLAADLGSQEAHDVRYLTARKDPESFPMHGVQIIKYNEDEIGYNNKQGSEIHKAIAQQSHRGEVIQTQILKMIDSGFIPELIFFHGGNGLGLYIKPILPKATVIGYFEWYFSSRCANLIFNRNDREIYNFIAARNFSSEREILAADLCVVPTRWQASQFPKKLQDHLTIIFDGIDFDFFRPASEQLFNFDIEINGEDGQLVLKQDDLLLSYATRGMEPMRGFPQFMRALPTLLNDLPNLKVLIGGRDRSAYGPPCPTHDGSWKNKLLDEIPSLKNHPRVTYTGLMSYENYRLTLQRSNLHCYFTEAYVTSWSLFEAAACGTPILTNESPATNGTVPIPPDRTIKNIEDIYKPKAIEIAKTILQEANTKRKSILDEKFSLINSKRAWMQAINQTITSKHK